MYFRGIATWIRPAAQQEDHVRFACLLVLALSPVTGAGSGPWDDFSQQVELAGQCRVGMVIAENRPNRTTFRTESLCHFSPKFLRPKAAKWSPTLRCFEKQPN